MKKFKLMGKNLKRKMDRSYCARLSNALLNMTGEEFVKIMMKTAVDHYKIAAPVEIKNFFNPLQTIEHYKHSFK